MADAAKKKTKLPKGRHASQIKRERQDKKKKARNQILRSVLKTAVKKVRKKVLENNKEAAAGQLQESSKTIQKMASKGIIHKRNAARRISRLAQAVNKIQ